MAENGKKAPSTPRKAAAPETARSEAAAPKQAARKAATKKATTPEKTGRAQLLTMPSPAPAPTHDEIAELARKYWAERGHVEGHQEEDWLRAEQELRGKAS